MKQEELNTAKKILMDYLNNKKLRIIPKRFLILEQIYLFDDHFSIDMLYEKMIKEGSKISRATLYNSMELFVDAKLVMKSQFGSGLFFYEKSLNKKIHHHCICTACGKIQEFQDAAIKTAIQTKRIAKFKQTSYSLCVYGFCATCLKSL
jgi:Fur family ferric uptake transcriptional regulator